MFIQNTFFDNEKIKTGNLCWELCIKQFSGGCLFCQTIFTTLISDARTAAFWGTVNISAKGVL